MASIGYYTGALIRMGKIDEIEDHLAHIVLFFYRFRAWDGNITRCMNRSPIFCFSSK